MTSRYWEYVLRNPFDEGVHGLENWLTQNLRGEYVNFMGRQNDEWVVTIRMKNHVDAVAVKLRWCEYVLSERRV